MLAETSVILNQLTRLTAPVPAVKASHHTSVTKVLQSRFIVMLCILMFVSDDSICKNISNYATYLIVIL